MIWVVASELRTPTIKPRTGDVWPAPIPDVWLELAEIDTESKAWWGTHAEAVTGELAESVFSFGKTTRRKGMNGALTTMRVGG